MSAGKKRALPADGCSTVDQPMASQDRVRAVMVHGLLGTFILLSALIRLATVAHAPCPSVVSVFETFVKESARQEAARAASLNNMKPVSAMTQ